MIRARRRPDGRYRLDYENRHAPNYDLAEVRRWIEARQHSPLVREDVGADGFPEWTCEEGSLAILKVEKVFGVLAGPSSCGCEPAMFRWVTEGEVNRGKTDPYKCVGCSRAAQERTRVLWFAPLIVWHQCDIIDVMGEADTALATYEAEFMGKHEAVS